MSKKLTFALSLALAALPLTARALGLGEIKLNSALNDKFSADIQIVGATSDELDSLDVKLADFAKFSQAGLDHPEVLNQLQFVVVRNPDGTAYVHISSLQAVREPFLDFLIDANWNNGELIREYTVLLNPPTFQSANAAKPAPAPAAASAPTAAAAPTPVPVPAPGPSVTTPTQTTAPAAVAVAPQAPPAAASAPAPEVAASPPPAPAPSAEQAPAQRALGANYGPIHRGETLSGIAKSVRPEGVTLNQMMIAIYQENPEVFMHNINRMKAGYILRMPTASDAQAVSVTDANAQVREQMEAWRNKTPAEATPPPASTAVAAAPAAPALQLVAPSSAASSNAPVPGAEKQGTGVTATKGGKPGKKGVSAAAPPPPTPSASQAPISVNSNSMAAVQQQATQQNVAPTPPLVPPPSAATNVPLPKPAVPSPKPAVPAAPAESGGGIMDYAIYGLLALIGIAVLVLLVVMVKKRKGKASTGATPGRIKGADWLKQEQVGAADTTEGSSTTRTKAGKAKKAAAVEDMEKTVLTDSATEVAGGGDSDKTMLMASPPPMPTGDTMVGGAAAGGGAAKLDVSDPMAEADFHMAYGLYDQAADVLKKALRQEPGRREVQLKLLEVFFTAGDKANFVGEAKKLRAGMGDTPDKDWESVAIMGRQVAPDEAIFSAAGASVGAGAVDIALDDGGTGTVVGDLDALGGAFTAEPPPAPPTQVTPAPAPAADNALEFSIPDLEPAAAPAPAPAPAAAPADGGMEFNLGDLNFEPTPAAPKAEAKKAPTMGTDEPTVATDFGTDSQVEFDKALNDLASFVNTNVPPQPADMDTSETHDKTLAIRPPKPEGAAAEPMAAAAEPAGGGSISEIGTKLDLARAYIDMGDPDGAKSILEEVVAEGNAQQKQEAQELMKHVS
ncbi:MAG: FimV/HubP family polar landmark protein [Bacillota bacterium]